MCGIESSDKASKKCRRQRQQETEKTRKDYELGDPDPYYNLPSLKRSQAEVYRILLKDDLDKHWIQLYNSTIFKNLGLLKVFLNKTNNTEFQAAGDYTRTYNFFVQNRLASVQPVGISSIQSSLYNFFEGKT